MRASSKRVLSILASAGLFFGALVVYLVLIRPAYEEVDVLRAEVQARQKLLAYQREIVGQIKRLLVEFQSVARLKETVSAGLPQKGNVSEAVGQFGGLAKMSGLAVQSVQIQPLAVKPPSVKLASAKGLGTLRFTIKAAGNYDGLKRFLELVETNIRVMDVGSFKAEATADKNVFSYAMVVDVYHQGE